jgi:predicted CopG family antitoxin
MALKQKLEQAAFELGQARATVAIKQEEYDRLFKLVSSGAKSSRSPKVAAATKPEVAQVVPTLNGHNGSASTDIEKLLESEPKKEFSYSDVLTKLPNVKKASVATLLFRLQREGKVTKVGRGLWKTTKLI